MVFIHVVLGQVLPLEDVGVVLALDLGEDPPALLVMIEESVLGRVVFILDVGLDEQVQLGLRVPSSASLEAGLIEPGVGPVLSFSAIEEGRGFVTRLLSLSADCVV